MRHFGSLDDVSPLLVSQVTAAAHGRNASRSKPNISRCLPSLVWTLLQRVPGGVPLVDGNTQGFEV
jgi:hypothetical protein